MSVGVGSILSGQNDRYRLIAVAGKGGVGVVWEALALSTGQRAAVKVLHAERFDLTDTQVERMRLEIGASLKVKSHWVVCGLDHGEVAGLPFLVLEWLAGGTLQGAITRANYDQAQAVRWCAQLLKGMNDLHVGGHIHRDIKPNNVLLTKDGVAKLGDLGIAKELNTAAALTVTVDQMGSLLYISSRQRADVSSCSSRDDFYSLCLVIYEVFAGRRIHVNNPPLAYLRPPLAPPELIYLIDRGMQDRDDWMATYHLFRRVLDLNNECLDATVPGSTVLAGRAITLARERTFFVGQRELNALSLVADDAEERTLRDEVFEILDAAFREMNDRLRGHGYRVSSLSRELENDSGYFGVSLASDLDAMLNALDIATAYYERSSCWATVNEDDNGTVSLDGVGGKRIDVSYDFMPKDWDKWSARGELSQADRDFLFEYGLGAALGAVVGALDWCAELMEGRAAAVQEAEAEEDAAP
ncbi:MAG: serine/threonine-protein kinase [Myxococcota bacterium]